MYFDGFLCYDRKKKSSSHLSGKKKRYSRLSVGCVVLAITTGKKKVPVVCLAGCAVVVLAITTGKKKVPVICLAGCQFLVLEITTGKKKVPVVCLADCAVASVFGSGDYDRKKKKFQLSVWAGCVTTGKKKFQSSPERLRPENKKVQVVIKFVLVQLEL